MDSFIFIDGIAFWVWLIASIFFLFAFICVGTCYMNSERKNILKDKQLKKLRTEYNILIGEYQKATFKLPEADEDV